MFSIYAVFQKDHAPEVPPFAGISTLLKRMRTNALDRLLFPCWISFVVCHGYKTGIAASLFWAIPIRPALRNSFSTQW